MNRSARSSIVSSDGSSLTESLGDCCSDLPSRGALPWPESEGDEKRQTRCKPFEENIQFVRSVSFTKKISVRQRGGCTFCRIVQFLELWSRFLGPSFNEGSPESLCSVPIRKRSVQFQTPDVFAVFQAGGSCVTVKRLEVYGVPYPSARRGRIARRGGTRSNSMELISLSTVRYWKMGSTNGILYKQDS